MDIVSVSNSASLEAINRSEVDIQIATAHRFPRDIEDCKHQIVSLACMDDDVAYNCFYHLERTDKNGQKVIIEGPSVRLAEIIATSWRNLRVAARVIGNDGKTITAQGVCHDLETNVAISVENKRSIVTSKGYTYSEDMQVVVGNAAAAIALRNAVCKVVPQVLIKSCVKEIQAKALEHIKKAGVSEMWNKWLGYMQKTYRLTEAQILKYLGRKSAAEVTEADLMNLSGAYQAINEGTTTVEETFKTAKQDETAKKIKDAAQSASDKAAAAINKSTGKK